jgi:hypothetical protein
MKSHTNSGFQFLQPTSNHRAPLGLFALILAFAALLSLTGCIGATSAGTNGSKTSSNSAATLAASSASLNFGSVAPGSSTPQTLTLSNTGTAAITISQATISGAGFSLLDSMSPVSIAAGQQETFRIQFAPKSAGSVSGSISIASDASDSLLTVSLIGTGSGPLAFTVQPASQVVKIGQTVNFAVVVSGSGTITYQWKKNGTPISGATAASYQTPAVTAADNGAVFTVVATAAGESITSNPAVVTESATAVAPAITAEPLSKTVTVGQIAAFGVTATGTAPLTYQWNKDGAAISGATSASYTSPAASAADNGAQFTVSVTDAVGSVTSSAAILTVNAAPSILAQPASRTVSAGQTAAFSVSATGTGTLSYQWKKGGVAISGATNPSYTTPATAASDNGAQFTVTITNSVGSVTSAAATLTVTSATVIVSQPAGQSVTVGQTATFRVTASGSGTLTYQWKKNGTAISGATLASYTTPPAATTDNGSQFTVTVTGASGSVTSNAAPLKVLAPVTSSAPAISSQPASTAVTVGQTATFTVTATGSGTLTYQWSKNGAAISGATSTAYTTPATTSADSGAQFTVTVTNSVSSVTSSAAILTVNASPTLILNASQTSLNFSSVNIGSSSKLPVNFKNAGTGNVTISNVTISGAGYTAAGVSSGQIVTPGQTVTLEVTFTPSSAGALPGNVTVTSNATNPTASVSLSGTGVQPVTHMVSLSWTASTSTVTGYNVYRSTVSGGPYTKVNSSVVAATTYSDSAVQASTTYFYVITSVDAQGVESAYSNEVSVTVP